MTLTMSVAPTKINAISDSTRLCEIPNNTVNAPNPATHHNIVRPAFRRIGRYARISAIVAAPNAGALRSRPSPQGPILSISRA